MARTAKNKSTAAQSQPSSYWQKLEGEVQSNQSKVSMLLGGLIILVVGILIFNFFNKNKPDINGSAPSTQQEQQMDVSPENLPGKYTVKEGDTLFTIAEKYYKDGYKFSEIVKANNLSSPDVVVVGQVLEIPKMEAVIMEIASESATPSPTMAPTVTPESTATPAPLVTPTPSPVTTPSSDTEWGPKITETTYTVVEGDWLSKIAARAYGDVFSYQKIAQANHISNPDLIEPGMVLVIPR